MLQLLHHFEPTASSGSMTAEPSFVPLFHSAPPPRRRGRPPGAKAQVVRDPRALGIHHFAFVRSSLLGLDLRDAFDRYLAWSETTTDLRYVQNRRDALLKHIIEAGRQHDATLPTHAKITSLLDLLRSNAAPPKTVALPSMDDWVESEGMDPDAWSEADLLAEYKAHFGLNNEDALEAVASGSMEVKDLAGERVKALNYLETVLSVIPRANDRLDSWFARPVVTCLRNVGLLTLEDLVRYINAHGHRWHSRIQRFGAQRARQVLNWLILEQEHLGLKVSGSVHEPKSKQALRVGALLPAMGASLMGSVGDGSSASILNLFGPGSLVAGRLGRMQGSPTLVGEQGVFRSHMANALGARNDLEAVTAWLFRYQEKPSTQRSYRKEIERFLLWCAQELHKPLSSVTSPDCARYRTFLQAVPRTWIEPAPLKRTDPGWRAFRTQPSPASQKQTLVILQTLFGGLVDAGYLVANPMRALMKSFNLPASKMDIRRSFTEAEWTHVLNGLEAMPAGPGRLRLTCLLELLVSSGLRLEELARATHGDLRKETLPELPETWILSATGKRNKTRDVPLKLEVVYLLAQHEAQFVLEDKNLSDEEVSRLPLIRTLHPSVAQWGRGEKGELQAVPESEQAGSALSAAGIYAVLKRFFKQLAKTAGEAGLDPKRFEKASTHWMRHTFVRQALVDGVPIEVAGEIVGHASIDTTSLYATQELARKIKAVQGMKRREVKP